MQACKKLLPLALAVLIAGLLVVAPVSAETKSQTFDVAPGGRLVVDTDLGSIEVDTVDSDRVTVDVTWSGRGEDDFSVDFTHSQNHVTVRGDYQRSGFFGWASSPKVRFEIKVPQRFDVDVKTSGGSVSIADLTGEAHAKTSGGSLSFGHITGSIWGRTSGGSISLEGGRGPADIHTSGGSIRIGEVDGEIAAQTSGGSIHIVRAGGNVKAETSGGSIKVDEVMGAIDASTSGGSVTAYLSQQPKGDCRLSTSGGRVVAYLADGVAVDLDAKSSGGGVTSDLTVASEVKSRTSLVGQINGGGPRLTLRSSGGGVRLLKP